MASSTFADRPVKKLLLFDVDDTLTLPRQLVSREMFNALAQLRKKLVIGFVGGSDLNKISEQLALDGAKAVEIFDYGFAENGLVAYKMGKELPSQSFIKFFGDTEYKKLVKFLLHYIADLDIPIKRLQERAEFEAYDKIHQVRATFVQKLKETFPQYDLTYSIGGKISFDVFPRGWDKTYALKHVEDEGFEEIHFFGDKTYQALAGWSRAH
ncbi:Phosphomannomutase [Tulasnella sp. UAMH 9824]|nr:Phosphomannomutase [Tulasnella sp. UAMH 9824]